MSQPICCNGWVFYFIMENWVNVKDYEGHYLVSNYGKIKNAKSQKILKPRIDRYGYIYYGFLKNGIHKQINIHRVVALSFLPNDNIKNQVNHIDGDKTNNNVLNLEWVSYIENASHRSKKMHKSSKFLGVTFNKNEQKWKSQIFFNGTKKGLGTYKTEIEAYQARVNFEKENNISNKYL